MRLTNFIIIWRHMNIIYDCLKWTIWIKRAIFFRDHVKMCVYGKKMCDCVFKTCV